MCWKSWLSQNLVVGFILEVIAILGIFVLYEVTYFTLHFHNKSYFNN